MQGSTSNHIQSYPHLVNGFSLQNTALGFFYFLRVDRTIGLTLRASESGGLRVQGVKLSHLWWFCARNVRIKNTDCWANRGMVAITITNMLPHVAWCSMFCSILPGLKGVVFSSPCMVPDVLFLDLSSSFPKHVFVCYNAPTPKEPKAARQPATVHISNFTRNHQ